MKKITEINALSKLPKEFRLDELFERLIVLEKIESGLEDIRKRKIVSHEKVKKNGC